jgi:hypothetical protein
VAVGSLQSTFSTSAVVALLTLMQSPTFELDADLPQFMIANTATTPRITTPTTTLMIVPVLFFLPTGAGGGGGVG